MTLLWFVIWLVANVIGENAPSRSIPSTGGWGR